MNQCTRHHTRAYSKRSLMMRRRARTNYYDYQLTPRKVILNCRNFDVFEREIFNIKFNLFVFKKTVKKIRKKLNFIFDDDKKIVNLNFHPLKE